ncbi:hypothetical protein BpOF4_06040 [Alkalihalophilus pseudofirmus OF4]|uniref:Uncharacterized protein n=1 Tax=Alkalihalophilus pseudofirmus (strain ATCC BAA-2126 / JCM 17055 / OF4) TaxID=398511 RepID=D3FZM8_ALKPO|nr:hypothetical protein [Alkalihalophilus pseudofirmus]ADC49270.1 hypothetical protein BpOF4_06040 [Alkalihalophilus pseudofirmus OF4]
MFINLGITGRHAVLEKVLDGDGKVETAVNKAEELEASVQAVKQHKTIDSLRNALEVLLLQKLATIPAEYGEEVLQKLVDNSNWNGLFQLERLSNEK